MVDVATFNDLENMERPLNQDFFLTQDIDAEGQTLTPIGESFDRFNGVFDGQGHTISNLVIDGANSATGFTGMFEVTNSAVIKNLTLEGVTVNSDDTGTAAIAGQDLNGSVFYNIEVTGEINGSFITGTIVGDMNGSGATVSSCVCGADITNTSDNVGGVVGSAEGSENSEITHCIFEGTIVSESVNVGGIVGIGNGDVRRCISRGELTFNDVNGIGSAQMGGIVGNLGDSNNPSSALIEECIFDGKINSDAGSESIGGAVGAYFTGGEIARRCITKGTIEVPDASASRVGGFVGWYTSFFSGTPLIEDCYSLVDLTVANDSEVGGFAGEMADGIERSYYGGVMDITGTAFGFSGTSGGGNAVDCYWDEDTSGATQTGGDATGLSEADMTENSEATMAGFDFNNVWEA